MMLVVAHAHVDELRARMMQQRAYDRIVALRSAFTRHGGVDRAWSLWLAWQTFRSATCTLAVAMERHTRFYRAYMRARSRASRAN